jgi:hypothetical protein
LPDGVVERGAQGGPHPLPVRVAAGHLRQCLRDVGHPQLGQPVVAEFGLEVLGDVLLVAAQRGAADVVLGAEPLGQVLAHGEPVVHHHRG